jgi:hypothetical protein
MTTVTDQITAELVTNELVETIRKWMPAMNDLQRVELFNRIKEDYCGECGSKYTPCYCTNED